MIDHRQFSEMLIDALCHSFFQVKEWTVTTTYDGNGRVISQSDDYGARGAGQGLAFCCMLCCGLGFWLLFLLISLFLWIASAFGFICGDKRKWDDKLADHCYTKAETRYRHGKEFHCCWDLCRDLSKDVNAMDPRPVAATDVPLPGDADAGTTPVPVPVPVPEPEPPVQPEGMGMEAV